MFHYAAIALAACLCALPAGAAGADTLFERLGGQAGVTAIASELMDRSSQDPATRRSFHKVDLKRVKFKLAEQLCEISGGPCKYSGDTMKQVHGGLRITDAEFYALVAQLRAVLDARGIAQPDKNALLALLAPMHRDVVERQP
ncbi:group 1 truncated hemoglobin [Chitinimonas sp. BJYL2]|uniref:group I truncated hemoglobin n=1 Tax=Chitinimonas sp. BJYL2 TaxID=2976696 RepID=UPI0022B4B650|nr:group 1 truncated hemoglobin [Chitinimonas sp. BJYL2]